MGLGMGFLVGGVRGDPGRIMGMGRCLNPRGWQGGGVYPPHSPLGFLPHDKEGRGRGGGSGISRNDQRNGFQRQKRELMSTRARSETQRSAARWGALVHQRIPDPPPPRGEGS